MNIESSLGDLSSTIARSMHDTFKREIKAKLAAQAMAVVEEVAEQIAKDLVLKVDHVIANHAGMAFGPEVRVYLRVNEKDERSYSIEKTVKQV